MRDDVWSKKLYTYFTAVNNDNVLNRAVATALRNVLWGLSEHRMERIINGLTNLVDDHHAVQHLSEHNLKRMSVREENIERIA